MSDKKEKEKKKTIKGIAIGVVITVISGLIMAGITAEFNSHTAIKLNEEKTANIEKTLEGINDSIALLTQSVNENGRKLEGHEKMLEYLTKQASGVSLKKLKFNSDILAFVNNEGKLASPKLNNSEFAATDLETNQNYTASQLRNVSMITYYTEAGNEIYFYGQYNENDCWNGLCILNVYKNGGLVTIFEGVYNNGALCSYKRISCEDGESWKITDRTDYDTYTTGETWIYKKTKAYAQKISPDNLDISNILTQDSFMKDFDERLTAYYSGKTSDGFYNDDTGNAFLILYFDEGKLEGAESINVIQTLYKGRFSDGYFNDETGKAWYITRETDTKYMYYEGSFSGKTADNKIVEEFTNPAGKDYIAKKLKEKGFEKYESEFYADYE